MDDFEVRIDKIRLVNFKKFIDTTVTLDPSLTVLSGKNGAGKSSVLSGVNILLSWIIARLRNEDGKGMYVSALDVNNAAINGCVTGELFNGEATVPSKAKPGYAKEYVFNITPIRDFVNNKREQLANNKEASLPVFVYYGVKRAVLDIPIRTRKREYSIFDTFDKSLQGAANFRGFFTWFRACEDWENQQIARTKQRVEHPGLKAFREAMSRFMPEYRNIYIERHPLSMMLEKEGQTLNAEQLSDGEKIYLALIGDLCHRLSLANPMKNPLFGKGIVLIDEIDLHLHPQWQSEITNALTRTFPNIQFIITTHSPHVINSVPTSSLRIINTDGTIEMAPYGYGMPSEIILGDIMNLSNDVPREVIKVIECFNDALRENDSDKASVLLQSLQALVPQHPELPRMRKRVERMTR
ncbi:MAG: AAA family ATPase [Muribaculaceae bacterium]|nr:AAA family ATPase [Muribaculaceae bacterium]